MNGLILYDIIADSIMPPILISILNILLFIRVIKQKQRLRQQVQWHKYRRMIIQLAACSSLFILFDLPLMCLILAEILGLPYGATGQFELFIYFMSGFVILWMPFVCLGSSPEIWIKLKRIIRLPIFTNRIIPQILHPNQ